jgi:hypothetical protein
MLFNEKNVICINKQQNPIGFNLPVHRVHKLSLEIPVIHVFPKVNHARNLLRSCDDQCPSHEEGNEGDRRGSRHLHHEISEEQTYPQPRI